MGTAGSVAARAIVKDLEMTISNRIPVLTPQGRLMLAPTDEARILPDSLRDRLESAFERGAGTSQRGLSHRLYAWIRALAHPLLRTAARKELTEPNMRCFVRDSRMPCHEIREVRNFARRFNHPYPSDCSRDRCQLSRYCQDQIGVSNCKN